MEQVRLRRPAPKTPYQRYQQATVNAQMPAAWTESTVEKVAPAACNPDTSQLERVLIADQARNTPAEFMDTPVQVYLISRYYCSDKDQHLNVVLMMAREWPNAAQVLPNGTPDGS